MLWELTLATAYWLGLRKTYKLALRTQRRLIGPQHPRLRDFVQRRTRNVFDVALTVHKGIQERDLSVGRSLGNFILRFLDRMRPSAHIRGSPRTNCNPEEGKFLSGCAESVQERSVTKYSSGTKTSVGQQSETGLGSVHDRPFVSYPNLGLNLGQTIRNRISVSFGRTKSGFGRLNPVSETRISLGLASRFGGQPVREKQEFSLRSASSGALVLPGFAQEHSKFSFPKHSIFRKDITQWLLRETVPTKEQGARI